MTVVSGDITIVTETPALVTEVRVHAPETRTFGDGVMTTLSAPVSYSPQSGEVLFNAAPGPAVLSLKSGSRPLGAVELVVGDVPQESLRDAYERAALADGRTVSELEQILEQIRDSVGVVTGALGEIEAGGATQVSRVVSAGTAQVGRVSDAGDDAVSTVEAAIVDTVQDRDRAEAAAAGSEASASEAAGSAVAADESAGASRGWARQSEESAVESESSSVVSLDSSAAAVAAAKVLLEWEAPDAVTVASTEVTGTGTVVTMTDGTEFTVARGLMGLPGADAEPLVVVSSEVTESGTVVELSDGTTVTVPRGPKGERGEALTITGTVPTAAELPGDLGPLDTAVAWITADDGHLHVWGGDVWTDVGEIRGPQGEPGEGASSVAQVAGLGAALDERPTRVVVESMVEGATPDWQSLEGVPAAFPPSGHEHPVAELSDATSIGRAVVRASSQGAARSAIGAGTSNLELGGTSSTAKRGDWTPTVGQVDGLDEALAGKTGVGHQHVVGDISDLPVIDTDQTLTPGRIPVYNARWTLSVAPDVQEDYDAAPKKYVDDQVATSAPADHGHNLSDVYIDHSSIWKVGDDGARIVFYSPADGVVGFPRDYEPWNPEDFATVRWVQENARSADWVPTAGDVGARPDTWTPTASQVGAATLAQVDARVNARPAMFSGNGSPPSSIPGAVAGDFWVDTSDPDSLKLYKITGV